MFEDYKISLKYATQRLEDMKTKRAETIEGVWDMIDQNYNKTVVFTQSDGLKIAIPTAKTLVEIHMGQTNGKVDYDILPDGQTNVQELQATKYAMMFFLDGNNKENFWNENKYMRQLRAKYGSGVMYTGLRKDISYSYELKEGLDDSSDIDLLSSKYYNKIDNINRYLFPKNIHIRDFYVDDMVYGTSEFSKARDCIYKEKLSKEEFYVKFGDKPYINTENISSGIDTSPKNPNDNSVNQDEVIVYYYFNRIHKKYIIFTNENNLILDGIYIYEDGGLPFEMCQFYTRDDRIRGEGITERIMFVTVFYNEIFQDILSRAQIESGVQLLVGNDDMIGEDWNFGGRTVNLLRTTGGAREVQQLNTNTNIGFFIEIINQLDKLIITSSGINPLSQVEPQAQTLGQEQLLEENKQVRSSSVAENYNLFLDSVLTMTLSRIKQFAPSLYVTKEVKKAGNAEKIIKKFPRIRVDGHTITEKGGKIIMEESLGKYGYFELKEGVVNGLGVKIITSSTNNKTQSMEKLRVNEYIDGRLKLGQIAQMDQTGEAFKKLMQETDFGQIIAWMNNAYGYDSNGNLTAMTDRDKAIEENLRKINLLKEMYKANLQQSQQQQGQQQQNTTLPSINNKNEQNNGNM